MKCSNCGKEMRKGYLFSSSKELSASQMKFPEYLKMQMVL